MLTIGGEMPLIFTQILRSILPTSKIYRFRFNRYGHGSTMPVSEDAEAEICSRLKRNRYIHKQPEKSVSDGVVSQ